jgi:sodium transport system permease protein
LLTPNNARFNPALFENPPDSERLQVKIEPDAPPWNSPEQRREMLRAGQADAVVLIPANLAQTLERQERVEIPIAYNSADERSQLTYLRVYRVIDHWNETIREGRRRQEGRPEGYTEPVRSAAQDVARAEESGTAMWAKIFPFILVIMALTGAFYPSVDLCAGEKERGTMETLLISPASRPEIVLGKFFTVMLASMLMALLNLASMGATAWALASQYYGAIAGPKASSGLSQLITAPSWLSAVWMILLLVPLSAFFSALCVALAVQARSMKEGQYYMTPLYMFAFPLGFMALAPEVELDLFTSLLPISGVSLLLRTLMQGDYEQARRYFLPVLLALVAYGLVALRWAVDQFKSEAVLFRAGERFDLLGWMRHLWRDKPELPSPAQALLCFVLILVGYWFMMPFLGQSLASIVAVQILLVFGVPTLLALLLTSNPARTLRLRIPPARFLVIGIALPLALFPLVAEFRRWVDQAFPIPDAVQKALQNMQQLIPSVWVALLMFAVLPAVCEEIAFRGYILSGLSRSYRPAWSIPISAALFGILHVLFSLYNQLFNATLLGLLLGLIALRSRSLMPGMLFHVTNNALGVVLGTLASNKTTSSWIDILLRDRLNMLFHTHWIAAGTAVSAALIWILFHARPDPADAPADFDSLMARRAPQHIATPEPGL